MAINNNSFTQFPENVPQVMSMLEYVSQAIKIARDVKAEADSGAFDGVGVASITFDAANKMTVTMTDGSTYVSPVLKGETGATGVGVASITFDAADKMTVTMTDGSTYVSPVLKGNAGADGADGADGVGIASITFDAADKMTVTMTDGSTYVSPVLKGNAGADGADGADGTDGVGISSIVFNSDYTMTITTTDGQTYTSGNLRGPQGAAGAGIVGMYSVDAFISNPNSTRTAVTGSVTLFEGGIAHWSFRNEPESWSAAAVNGYIDNSTGVNAPYFYIYKPNSTWDALKYNLIQAFSICVSTNNANVLSNGYLVWNGAIGNWIIKLPVTSDYTTTSSLRVYIDVWGTYRLG